MWKLIVPNRKFQGPFRFKMLTAIDRGRICLFEFIISEFDQAKFDWKQPSVFRAEISFLNTLPVQINVPFLSQSKSDASSTAGRLSAIFWTYTNETMGITNVWNHLPKRKNLYSVMENKVHPSLHNQGGSKTN